MAYRPRRLFLPYHARSQRWALIVAHRRCGKTVAAINDLVGRALNTDKARFSPNPPQYAFVAPFREQAKRVAWQYFMNATASPGMRIATNIADLTLTLYNGARLLLFGADNPDAMRGIYLDGVVLDEPAQMRARVFTEIIRPLLADRMGFATFIGTPAGKDAFWRMREIARQDPDWFYAEFKASQTHILPADEMRAMQRIMSEDEYLQELECSFDAAIRGSFYGKIINELGLRLGHYPHDPMLPVHVSLDLGYTDSTALWYWQALGPEVRYISAEEHSGLALADYVDLLRAKPYTYADIYLPHDARAKSLQTGMSIVEILHRAHGIKGLIAPELSVQQGIQSARYVLTSPTTYIDAVNCADGVEALRQYQREYDDKKQTFKEQPRHDHNSHYADSFRYSAIVTKHAARESANRVTPSNAPPRYDRSKPYGGNVKLEELWGSVPQPDTARY
jgi:phage terminase large subunit